MHKKEKTGCWIINCGPKMSTRFYSYTGDYYLGLYFTTECSMQTTTNPNIPAIQKIFVAVSWYKLCRI